MRDRGPKLQDLGDLSELAASITAHGVFEPLVVLSAAAFVAVAEADGGPERPRPGIGHVIVMGHRRAAAPRPGCGPAPCSACPPLNAAIWFNWQIGAPVKRSLIAHDH